MMAQITIAFLIALASYIIIVSLFFRGEVKAVFERDPAATNYWEVILTYPGLHALLAYRIAHRLQRLHVPFLPRWISQTARWATGIEIHPGARIGKGLFIDHGMGVVVGETTIIGDNVTLFQGVTLGGTGKERGKRHPTLGSNVVVGTGAKVLGNILIGDNVAIGANAVVLRDVPPNSTVVGVPGRIAKQEGRAFPGVNLDYTSLPDPMTERLERLQQEIDAIESHLKQWRKGQQPASAQPPTRH
jgi:serine O-acetyltransferase